MAFYRAGGGNEPMGNATEDKVLRNWTFSNDTGTGKMGTMPDNTDWRSGNVLLTPGNQSIEIPKGYHPGGKTVYFNVGSPGGENASRNRSITHSWNEYFSDRPLKDFTINQIKMSGAPYKPNKRSNAIDMYSDAGATSSSAEPRTNEYYCYKYLDTTQVPNNNPSSNVYSFAASEYPTASLPATHSYGSFNTTAVFNRGACGMHPNRIATWRSTDSGDNVINLTTDWIGAMLVIQVRENAKAPWGADVRILNNPSGSSPIIQDQYAIGGASIDSCYCHVQYVYNIHAGQQWEIAFYQPDSSSAPVIGNVFKIESSLPAGYFT